MTFQEKIKKEISPKKISPTIKEFAERVDNLRRISRDVSVSFSQVLLNARRGK